MKNDKAILLAGLCCLLPLVACSQTKQETENIKGVYDGYSYTPTNGVFTVFLKDWAVGSSLKEQEESDGAVVAISFRDTNANTYSIMATMTTRTIDPDAFVNTMVARNKAEGRNVSKSTTPNGIPCMLYTAQRKEEKANMGFGYVNIIFYHQQVIFDITIQTKPYPSPQKAADATDEAIQQLWDYTSFRGWTSELKEMTGVKDPRIPIVVSAMSAAAKEMKLTFVLAQTSPKPIVRITGQGSHGPMTLSLGIQSKDGELVTTEAISCLAGDRAQMAKMQEKYWEVLGEKLADQKLLVSRSKAEDNDLLMLPRKEK